MDLAGRPRGIIGGAILIAVGVVYLLLAVGFQYAGSVLFVALGLAFAAAWWIGTRPYVYLVPAGVLLSFGLGLFVPSVLGISGQYAALVFFAFLALGLVAVFLLAPERRWPLIPAAIFAALAVTVSFGRGDLIPAQALAYFVPLIVIAVGAYLLVEQRGH